MKTTRTRLAIVALVATAGLTACGSDDTTDTTDTAGSTAAGDAPAAEQPSGGTLALTADASTAGKCAAPNAETLAGFDTAFSGTVTGLDAGTATLAVDQWYAGGDGADTVTVDTPSEDLTDLLMAVDFQEGATYLVSATDGRVTLCGFSAEKTPELEGLYVEAFGQ